ncbi:Protein NifT [uncultured Alphaproteobacteria bacterium]|uniref:Protein NifT n=1 Tax=uncultured Alphaproteobacteria bacterium TaxID=91750 RepID=A0A212K5A4_9PROT|nr:Protein NifT [uncultured Alphaproteobacteria bacterium]
MPSVMVRRNDEGKLLFYVAKKDLEEVVTAVEIDTAEEWGGEVTLSDGERFHIEPISPPPAFPATLRFRRID